MDRSRSVPGHVRMRDTFKGAISRPALAGAGEGIHGGGGLVHDRTHLVVIPAVRVVVGDDHGGVGPVLLLLQEVDNVDDERLLVERIGVAGVAVLVARRLEEADCRKVAGVNGVEEVVRVVLVVCRVAVDADRAGRSRAGCASGSAVDA